MLQAHYDLGLIIKSMLAQSLFSCIVFFIYSFVCIYLHVHNLCRIYFYKLKAGYK